MARNLRDKIRLLIQDSYDLQQEAIVNKIERLFEEELKLQEEEREFNYIDLNYIQSVASQEFATYRHDQEALGKLFQYPDLVRTLCVVNATVGFLRQRGFLSTILRYNKK